MDEMTTDLASELLRTPVAERAMDPGDVYQAWADWLYETYGEGLPRTVLDLVYGQAYDYGRGRGLHEIQHHFVGLVELAGRIRSTS